MQNLTTLKIIVKKYWKVYAIKGWIVAALKIPQV